MVTKNFINKKLKNINLYCIFRFFLDNFIMMLFFLIPSFLHFGNSLYSIRYDTFFSIIYIISIKDMFLHFVFYSFLGDMVYGINHDKLIISHIIFISIFLIKNKSSIVNKHPHMYFIFILISTLFFEIISAQTISYFNLYLPIILKYMLLTFIFYRILYYLIYR